MNTVTFKIKYLGTVDSERYNGEIFISVINTMKITEARDYLTNEIIERFEGKEHYKLLKILEISFVNNGV